MTKEEIDKEYQRTGLLIDDAQSQIKEMELSSRIEYSRLVRIARHMPKTLFRVEKNIIDIRQEMKEQEKVVFKTLLWFIATLAVVSLGYYFFTKDGKMPDGLGWMAGAFLYIGIIGYPHLNTKFHENKFEREVASRERYEYEWFSAGLSTGLLSAGLELQKRQDVGVTDEDLRIKGREYLDEYRETDYLLHTKYALSVMVECKNLASGEVKDYWSI